MFLKQNLDNLKMPCVTIGHLDLTHADPLGRRICIHTRTHDPRSFFLHAERAFAPVVWRLRFEGVRKK